MSALKERIFNNWDTIRIMRLAIGLMLLVAGIQSRDWMIGLFSIFFIYQAVTATGCCGAGGCARPPRRVSSHEVTGDDKHVEYEEIK
jgi:hypothetical protein